MTETPNLDSSRPYLDPDLPLPERVVDLLSRLTLEEKFGLMSHNTEAIPRLGIPAYNYWGEALHGVARNGRATVFPQAINMAATWEPELIRRVAEAIADEGRAKFHETFRRKGYTDLYQGLTFWSPNVNIFRDPRWGRGQETWGEDPYLTGEMGAAFVRGLQGDHPVYLKTAACAKHYAVHSGPEKLRHEFNALASPRDLRETYLPAFQKLVTEAKVESVMGAYNRTNGEPCCASRLLLEEILRGEWGFEGHVVSDCWALADIHLHHKVTGDAPESAALALKAGCDLSCGTVYEREHFLEAMARGLITEADLDRALSRTLATRFKLGLFDPPERVPYASIGMEKVGSPEHRRLAHETAAKSVVLLKNRGNLLPLREIKSLFLTGPHAASTDVLLGNYYGLSDSLTTILEGIAAEVPEGVRLEYRVGAQVTHPNRGQLNWALTEAANAQVTVACMGLSPLLEGEEGESILSDAQGDRDDIVLPQPQIDFIKALVATGTRVVLVLSGGSAMALEGLEEVVEAILWVGYPGQEGGRAVAEAIFGKVNPSGKLPVTFYRSLEQLPDYTDYSMQGRTYRYFAGEPLFPFGFGLSYTSFAYRDLALSPSAARAGDEIRVEFVLENTGDRAGQEVVQVYAVDPTAAPTDPRNTLLAFQRVALDPGESKPLSFTLPAERLARANDQGHKVLKPGILHLEVGGCSPGSRGVELGSARPVRANLEVTL